MQNEQDKTIEQPDTGKDMQDETKATPATFHNPLDPNDDRKFTSEDLENEQKFKEALTERD